MPSGRELTSHAPVIAPADEPYTASKAGSRPRSASDRAIPAETVPRIPPPSMAKAMRSPSARCPGLLPDRARARSARSTSGWPASGWLDIAIAGGAGEQRRAGGAQLLADDRRAQRRRVEPDLHAAAVRVGDGLVLGDHPEAVDRAGRAQAVDPEPDADRAGPGDRRVIGDRELLDDEEHVPEPR